MQLQTFRSSKTTLWVGHKVTMRTFFITLDNEGRHQPEYQNVRKIQQTICSGSFRKPFITKKQELPLSLAKLKRRQKTAGSKFKVI